MPLSHSHICQNKHSSPCQSILPHTPIYLFELTQKEKEKSFSYNPLMTFFWTLNCNQWTSLHFESILWLFPSHLCFYWNWAVPWGNCFSSNRIKALFLFFFMWCSSRPGREVGSLLVLHWQFPNITFCKYLVSLKHVLSDFIIHPLASLLYPPISYETLHSFKVLALACSLRIFSIIIFCSHQYFKLVATFLQVLHCLVETLWPW